MAELNHVNNACAIGICNALILLGFFRVGLGFSQTRTPPIPGPPLCASESRAAPPRFDPHKSLGIFQGFDPHPPVYRYTPLDGTYSSP